MDNPRIGPYASFTLLRESIAHKAPTLIGKVNEVISAEVDSLLDHPLRYHPFRQPTHDVQRMIQLIAAETGIIIHYTVLGQQRRWSAEFTEHHEQLEP